MKLRQPTNSPTKLCPRYINHHVWVVSVLPMIETKSAGHIASNPNTRSAANRRYQSRSRFLDGKPAGERNRAKSDGEFRHQLWFCRNRTDTPIAATPLLPVSEKQTPRIIAPSPHKMNVRTNHKRKCATERCMDGRRGGTPCDPEEDLVVYCIHYFATSTSLLL
jgi:hypothetical protein